MPNSKVARLFSVAALGALALSGCASAPDGHLPPASFVSMQEGPGEDYVIGPLDELTITVWRNDELGAKVQVRPDGRITTPLVADMPAGASLEGLLYPDSLSGRRQPPPRISSGRVSKRCRITLPWT